MQPSYTVSPVSTGYPDFDTLLQADGIPTGNVCTVRSDPTASAYEFLLSIMRANFERGHFITIERDKPAVLSALRDLNTNLKTASQVVDLSNGTTGTELVEAVTERSLTPRDIVIIDTLNAVTDTDERAYSELYRHLKQIAIENEIVVICHYRTQMDSRVSFRSAVDYLSDFLLSISMSMSEEGIKQQLWVERLPVGEGLKESQRNTRLISVDGSGDQLSLNTGGRI